MPQLKYIKEYLPPYCLYGLEEIEPMFVFYEDNSWIMDYDDAELREIKNRTKQKARHGEDLQQWKYTILQQGISTKDRAQEIFIVLNYM